MRSEKKAKPCYFHIIKKIGWHVTKFFFDLVDHVSFVHDHQLPIGNDLFQLIRQMLTTQIYPFQDLYLYYNTKCKQWCSVPVITGAEKKQIPIFPFFFHVFVHYIIIFFTFEFFKKLQRIKISDFLVWNFWYHIFLNFFSPFHLNKIPLND